MMSSSPMLLGLFYKQEKKSSDLIGSLHLLLILFLYSGLVLFSSDISLAYSSGLFWLNQSTTYPVNLTHITAYSCTLFIQTQVSLFSFGTMDILNIFMLSCYKRLLVLNNSYWLQCYCNVIK